MSYPPPPGPPDPGPPNSPSPGWQPQPYQPQGGNWAAPPYGGPPRKDKAVLIIVLIAMLLAVILGIGGFVAYRLTAGNSDGGTAPAPPPTAVPIETPTTEATTPAPPKTTIPSAVPSKVPSKAPTTQPVPSKPVGKGTKAEAVVLAGRFVAQLNAGNAEAATAMGCAETRQMIPTLIGVWVKAPTKLTVTDAAIGQDPYIVPISGTTDGKKMGGMVIVQGGCIRVFQLAPN